MPSVVTHVPETARGAEPTALELARCVRCRSLLQGSEICPACSRRHPIVDGVLEAIDPLIGTNAVAARFYEGSLWPRFEIFEKAFLWCQGPGIFAARRQILRFLPSVRRARVLEVGVGSGANLAYLPADWQLFGVDVARSRLRSCLHRVPETRGRLVLAAGEALPFPNATFDAVFTVGGINYFSNPAATLREMKRVARPGGVVVAADERPDLHRFGIGSMIGIEAIDRFWLRAIGLEAEFADMVFSPLPRVETIAREVWPHHRRVPIWNRLGYCLVDSSRTQGGSSS